MEILNSEVSVLVGGKAGEGINRAGQVVAEILSGLGYEIYMNFDHPSLIKGGHNFSIVRASAAPAGGIRKNIDIVIALDKNTINLHRGRFFPETTVIFNSDRVKKVEGTGIPADSITKEAGGIPIMANSCLIGAFCRAAGLEWEFAEEILRKEFPVKTSLNIEIARKGYEMASPVLTLKKTGRESGKVVQGSEAIGLGLCFGGIEGYVAYPMSPASGILHFLASKTDELDRKSVV